MTKVFVSSLLILLVGLWTSDRIWAVCPASWYRPVPDTNTLNNCDITFGWYFSKTSTWNVAWDCQSGPYKTIESVGLGSCYSCTGSPCWPSMPAPFIDTSGTVTGYASAWVQRVWTNMCTNGSCALQEPPGLYIVYPDSCCTAQASCTLLAPQLAQQALLRIALPHVTGIVRCASM